MKLKKLIPVLLLLLPFIMQAQQVIRGEYFIDTDPGTGSGKALTSFVAADSITQTVNLTTTGLSVGFHRVYYRYKYNNGSWGFPEDRLFYVYDNTPPPLAITQPAISKGEYFIDTDPGAGHGLALPTFAASDSISQTLSLNTTGLTIGYHRVYYRYNDQNGKWGNPDDRLFYVYDNTPPVLVNQPQLTAGEYFIDTDPGAGKGTALPAFAAADSVNQTVTVTTSSALTMGMHVVYFRYKDQSGKWGAAEPCKFKAGNALTYSVTVPAGTNACYIAGTMNGWIQQAMTKVDATYYTLDIGVATVSDTYKYYSGPGGAYVEKNANNNDVSNRTYSASDLVAKWASVFTDVKNSFSANDILYGGKSFIRVQFDGNATINVFTLTGILLKQANATGNITIDNLKAGIYIVTINNKAYKVPVE